MGIDVRVVVEREDDGRFVAFVPNICGCASYGFTPEEAVENVMEAVHLCLPDQPWRA